MTDELKTIETDVNADAAKIKAAETSATGWVKTHIAIVWGLVGALFGFILGHLAR